MAFAKTPVTVRAQARGGKFLGMGVQSTPPTLVVYQEDIPVAGPLTFETSNSGSIGRRQANSSPYTIEVPLNSNESIFPAGTYYLTPTNDPLHDSLVTAELPLGDDAQDFTFVVTAYNGAPESDATKVFAKRTVSLSLTNIPAAGVVVEIPGLRITNVSIGRQGGQVTIAANIAMMCGCPIEPIGTTAPLKEPFWPSTEFSCTVDLAGPGGAVQTLPLICRGNSAFSTDPVRLAAGSYTAVVNASQPMIPENRNSVTTPFGVL